MNSLKYIKFGIIPSILIGAYWAVEMKHINKKDKYYTDTKIHDITTTIYRKNPCSFQLHKTILIERKKEEDDITIKINN